MPVSTCLEGRGAHVVAPGGILCMRVDGKNQARCYGGQTFSAEVQRDLPAPILCANVMCGSLWAEILLLDILKTHTGHCSFANKR